MRDKSKIDLESLSSPENAEQALAREAILKVKAGEDLEKAENLLSNEDMNEALKEFDRLIEMAKKDQDIEPELGNLFKILTIGGWTGEALSHLKNTLPSPKAFRESLQLFLDGYRKTKQFAEDSIPDTQIRRLIQKAKELEK